MRIVMPNEDDVRCGIGVLKSVALADGKLDPVEHAFTDALQRELWGVALDLDQVETAETPDDVRISDAAFARQLAHLTLASCLADRRTAGRKITRARAFADVLGADPSIVRIVELACAGDEAALARAYQGATVPRAAAVPSAAGAFLAGLAVLRPLPPSAQASWADAPPGSLAHEFHRLRSENGFAFAETLDPVSAWMERHDMVHLLGGYGVDPAGELAVCGFTAGALAADGERAVVGALLQFNFGVKVALVAEPTLDALHAPGAADRFFEGVRRGSEVAVDLARAWDYRATLDEPLDAVRQALRVPPLRGTSEWG